MIQALESKAGGYYEDQYKRRIFKIQKIIVYFDSINFSTNVH